MSAQHTPGPWQVNHRYTEQVDDCDGEKRGCAPVAVMRGTREEKHANALLIAAAPELLAALEALVSAGSSANLSAWFDAMKLGRAAIAKATGSAE